MPEDQTADSNYQKGFNEGYLITKHLPEVSKQLAEIKSNSPRIEGFQDGRRQFVLEQTKERQPSWMKTEVPKSVDIDKRKDDKELDR
jgi:hypothetical protein